MTQTTINSSNEAQVFLCWCGNRFRADKGTGLTVKCPSCDTELDLTTKGPPHVHSVLNEQGATADTYQGAMAECPYCQQIKTHITVDTESKADNHVETIPTEAERQRIWDNNGELPEPKVETELEREYRELTEKYEQQLKAIKEKYNSPAHKLKLQRDSEYIKTITAAAEKPKRCSLIVSIYVWLVKVFSPSR